MSPPLAPYRLPHDASDSVLGSLGPALELAGGVGGASGRMLAELTRSAFVSGMSLGLTVAACVAAGGVLPAFTALPATLSRPPVEFRGAADPPPTTLPQP